MLLLIWSIDSCKRFPSDWNGRQMALLFPQSGFGEVFAWRTTLVLSDLAVAVQLSRYFAPVGRSAA